MPYLSEESILEIENSRALRVFELCLKLLVGDVADLLLIILVFSYLWNLGEIIKTHRLLILLVAIGLYGVTQLKDFVLAKLGIATPISAPDCKQLPSVTDELKLIHANQSRQERIRARGFDLERLLDENERIYRHASGNPKIYRLYCYPFLSPLDRKEHNQKLAV
jgi:hypothetical protein